MKIFFTKHVFICLSILGCGTWAGNPNDGGNNMLPTVELKFKGDFTQKLTATPINVIGKKGTPIGSIEFNQVLIGFSAIELEAKEENENEREIEFEGEYFVDLVSNQITPNLPTIQVNKNIYNNIELKLAKINENQMTKHQIKDKNVKNKSIYVSGTYTNTSLQRKPFILSFDIEKEIKVSLPAQTSEIVLLENQLNTILIAFKLNTWINFNSAQYDLSDVNSASINLDIATEDVALKSIKARIHDNIFQSARFGHDFDDDGELDDDNEEESSTNDSNDNSEDAETEHGDTNDEDDD